MSQEGKVALVTGGAQGIGRSFVEHLLREGAAVAICDLKKDVGNATAEELAKKFGINKVIFLECDVTNRGQLEGCFKTTVDKFSHLDIVVNNAGVAIEKDPIWTKCIEINFNAVVVGTILGFKYMGKDRGGAGGVVVNIASVTALEPWATIPVYSSTKAAVNQYTRSVGQDLYYQRTGVKVIAINPGMTETPLTSVESVERILGDDPLQKEHFITQFGTYSLQKPENLGRGLIEILKKAENGTLWTIENGDLPKITIIK